MSHRYVNYNEENMKVTRRQLRRIILEAIKINLATGGHDDPYSPPPKPTQNLSSAEYEKLKSIFGDEEFESSADELFSSLTGSNSGSFRFQTTMHENPEVDHIWKYIVDYFKASGGYDEEGIKNHLKGALMRLLIWIPKKHLVDPDLLRSREALIKDMIEAHKKYFYSVASHTFDEPKLHPKGREYRVHQRKISFMNYNSDMHMAILKIYKAVANRLRDPSSFGGIAGGQPLGAALSQAYSILEKEIDRYKVKPSGLLEAIEGPESEDSFILDPELPGKKTKPVFKRRHAHEYEDITDTDIEELAKLHGYDRLELEDQWRRDVFADSLMGDPHGTKEYSRASRISSLKKLDDASHGRSHAYKIRNMWAMIDKEMRAKMTPDAKQLLADVYRTIVSDPDFLRRVLEDHHEEHWMEPEYRDMDVDGTPARVELDDYDSEIYLGTSAIAAASSESKFGPVNQSAAGAMLTDITADSEFQQAALGSAIISELGEDVINGMLEGIWSGDEGDEERYERWESPDEDDPREYQFDFRSGGKRSKMFPDDPFKMTWPKIK